MKTYKGFNTDMTCRGFQYEEGKEYKHEGEVKACKEGFHACEDPIDCFGYYPPATSVYHEVEQDGDISKDSDDTKVASSVIKIGARLDVLGIAKAHFEYVKARTTFENTDPKQATAGNYGAATAGYKGAATAGNYGAATAGDYGAATAGYKGAATSRGSSTVGEKGIACARGNGCKVKGGLGAVLVLVEENRYDNGINAWKAEVVDGERIKADSFYTLKDGEFIEC
ncbi:MAG: hypothetical protein J6V42_06185 [Clostridia bacterium]|nr:hypothetical protein [Clostridia bacterium]